MSHNLEEELERVLRSAGESAPRPELNLVDQIGERGRRRRRNQVRTVVACGTAIVTVGVVGLAVDAIRPGTFAPADGTTIETAPLPKQKQEKPAKKTSVPLAKSLWPQAVHQIPRKLPDGRTIFPLTFLDADTLLITTQSSFEKTDALVRYDLKTQATEEVAKVDSPGYANNITLSDGWVVWSAYDEKSKQPGTEIWGVPVAGGQARRLVVAPGAGIDFLAVGGGEVHWSYRGNKNEVYSAPLTGDGKPRAIPGSKGYHIVSWPWIGSPGDEQKSGPIPEQQVLYSTLRNVETGESRTTVDLKGLWSCGLTWCVGASDDKMYAQQRDGSGRKSTGAGAFMDLFAMRPMPLRDRFYVDGLTISDVHTGKTGRLSHDKEEGFRIPNDDRLHYSYVKNDRYELIDLAAIE
ncbi:hypothetical protein [Flindersiella endophytica]